MGIGKQNFCMGPDVGMLLAMHRYAALVGNNPNISIAELAAVFPDFERGTLYGAQMMTFTTKVDISTQMFNRLGGTVLIAKCVTEAAVTLADIPALLKTELAGVKGKATFGLRCVGVPTGQVRELYKECKNSLRASGVSSRYIGNERDAAKAVQLHDEGLLDPKSGCEIVILQDKGTLWIGRTITAQNIKAYTLRDMEKPVRDTTVGLLPPKLAQVLLNFGAFLAKATDAKPGTVTVFDPFCGTGVVPMEAMLMGMNVLASDVAEKAVKGTEKNVEWLRKTFKIAKKDIESLVWKQDATKTFAQKEKPAMVVTEGTLGPALKIRPTVKDAETYCKKAEELTAAFLKNVSETLPGTPVVMTLPIWYAQKKMIHLEKLWDRLPALKFRPVLPPHANPAVEGHFSLLYRRNDQFVGREIVLLAPVR